ncbi:MAG: 23S rRNA (guanosine(2251)-2'-O)-methyltransferase RlmB [Paludibacteraceae bacterium]|jgi:23S rRNA (guanosine2251-2'-O)-methyltransferase|nr:23S rRNA (guanosine(2251)-2'-O)-methyltransferase RlmB [Paludibacteraceae bacterium]HOI26571.1 23S rRNA (guanosine(2251)-2'-O)-methyltransferase RlmB [Paludibacteraceae bacterium]HPH62526.1 23S rRNA (guanosine(2251)-2'-O)-methyltransferase RlmB [Paludibacteraceae bacterium]HQF51144.1 23S rRNA (guanosine(2251)-2'-O)-methyltransferase RlmB [Paludibacteraceae bacterium]
MKENEMIFGMRAIIEAIQAGKEIDKIIIKKDMQSDLSHELFIALRGHDYIQVQRVPIERLNRYTRKNHQGAIAFICQTTYQHIDNIIPTLYEEGKSPFIVVLDGITDVRNFGAIARTCECAGVDAIIISSKGGAPVNADAINTSAGALHTIPVCKENNLVEVVKYLKSSGLQIVEANSKNGTLYNEEKFEKPLALVIGDEEYGVSPEINRLCDKHVQIPVLGSISNLNISVSAGIIIYEILRQESLAD